MRATDTSMAPPGRLDLSALRERERALDKIKFLERRTSTEPRGDAVSDAESRGGIGVALSVSGGIWVENARLEQLCLAQVRLSSRPLPLHLRRVLGRPSVAPVW